MPVEGDASFRPPFLLSRCIRAYTMDGHRIVVKGPTMPNRKTMKIGRSAITGRFMPLTKARQRPSTAVVETIKKGAKGK